MPFPVQDKTLTRATRLNTAMAHAQAAKGVLTSMHRFLAENRISAAKFNSVMADLENLRRQMEAIAADDGMDDFAASEIGRTVRSDANAILAKIREVKAAIKALVPANAQGFLGIVKWDTDDTFAWVSYGPQETTNLRAKLSELLALME